VSVDWDAVGLEAAKLLSGYLRVRSVNPPGDEQLAADYLASLLRERGFEPIVWQPAPGRANLLARLRGDGSRGGIILNHHMDVVAAAPERWSVDPFGGETRDGYVWGRGALDMKGAGIMHLLALDLLRRDGWPLARDVMLLALSDEEAGSRMGSHWVLTQHADDLRAEYVWDEGGFGLKDAFGQGVHFLVAVAEKCPLWLRLVVEGRPGHGGIPQAQNPAQVLVAALERVRRHRWPLFAHPVVCELLRSIAALQPVPQRWLLRHMHLAPVLLLAGRALLKEPALQAILQDTVSLTGLKAGAKENVIPQRAEAVLDVRLLPGHEPQAFVAELERVLADERVQVQVVQLPEPGSVTTCNGDPMYAALRKHCQQLSPGSCVAPLLTPGATDSAVFRQHGFKTFGLFPAVVTSVELARFHGIDERISIQNLAFGTRLVYEVLREMCQSAEDGDSPVSSPG